MSMGSSFELGAALTDYFLSGGEIAIAAGSAGCLGTGACWAAGRCAWAIRSTTCKELTSHSQQD